MGDANTDAFTQALAAVIDQQRQSFLRDGPPSAAVRRDRLGRVAVALDERREDLAAALSADFGHRSRSVSLIADVAGTLASLRDASENVERWMTPERHPGFVAGAEGRIERVPLGVVGIMGPWNFPVNLLFGPLAGVFAAGNRAVLKPSEFTPRTADLIAALVERRFAPEELAVVQGGPAEGQAFAEAAFDHIVFTGSTAVGRAVMRAAAERLTPVTLELGGKSPTIVTGDIDLALAAERIMVGKVMNAGQVCIAPDHVYVPAGRERAFVDAAVAAVRRILPDGLGSADYTSLIADRHVERLTAMVAEARDGGATVVKAFEAPVAANERRFNPTFIVDPPPGSAAMREEIFGPVLPVIGYTDIGAVIADIRSRPRPLALYYFGHDDAKARRVLDGVVSGGAAINDVLVHNGDEALPFGGVGASGMGAYHGEHGFRTFSHARGIYSQTESPDWVPPMQAPYGGRAEAMLAAARGA